MNKRQTEKLKLSRVQNSSLGRKDKRENESATKHILCVCQTSPSDTEADRAHVGQHVVEQVIASSSGLQVDVKLGEFQLNVIDVVQE